MLGFGRARAGRDAPARAAAERIGRRTREILALPEDAVVAVNEILCADPACPGSETVILVMVPGRRTRAFKAQAAMAELDEAALAAALADGA